MPVADYRGETAILRSLLEQDDLFWDYRKHALERMTERDISHADVENSLTNGHVTLIETAKRDIVWRVEGKDVDGRKICVHVACFADENRIKIITAFPKGN